MLIYKIKIFLIYFIFLTYLYFIWAWPKRACRLQTDRSTNRQSLRPTPRIGEQMISASYITVQGVGSGLLVIKALT